MIERSIEEILAAEEEILSLIERQTKGATTAKTKLEPKIPMIHPEERVDNVDDEEQYPR
jgi:hypothetical protein